MAHIRPLDCALILLAVLPSLPASAQQGTPAAGPGLYGNVGFGEQAADPLSWEQNRLPESNINLRFEKSSDLLRQRQASRSPQRFQWADQMWRGLVTPPADFGPATPTQYAGRQGPAPQDAARVARLSSLRQAVRELGEPARGSIEGEIRFHESLPRSFRNLTQDSGLTRLRAFGETGAPEVDWSELASAREVAYVKLLREGRHLDAVSYISPQGVNAFDREEAARAAGLSLERASEIEIFPVSVDGQPVALVRDQTGGIDWIVGGDPVPEIPPRVLPAVGSAAALLVPVETRGGLTEISAPLMRFGDPVAPVEHDALPRSGNTAQPVSATADIAGTETCGSPDDQLECFIPTVALHSRWRTYCSGALISDEWVLTAAHCLCSSGATHATIGNEAPTGLGRTTSPRLTVSLGDSVVFINGGFCPAFKRAPDASETYALGDLALVKLTNSLVPGNADPFATIGSLSQARSSGVLQIAGFGAREDDRWGGEKYVSGIAVSSTTCEAVGENGKSHSEEFGCVPGRELVAIDRELRADSCHGDSGAPAYAKLEDGRFVLIALVSRGLTADCGPGGIYALAVTETVRLWIRGHASTARFSDGSAALAADFSRKRL